MEKTSDYGSWNIPALKAELGSRGAKKTGRKRELVQRLEDYDRNKDFGKCPVNDAEIPYSMELPDITEYKDINANAQLPHVNLATIEGYLNPMEKKMDDRARNLYRERYVICARHARKEETDYIMARCKAEMSKSVSYQIDISLSKDGVVVECQCECAVGMGPDAHCKHVQCILFGLSCFTQTHDFLTHETCTQRLQTFHKCKAYKGSPLKAADLQLRQAQGTAKNIKQMSNFDPRPPEMRNQPNYMYTFQNLCINFQANINSQNVSLPMPILQIVPPANMYAISNDHDYLKRSPEDLFLHALGVVDLTAEEMARIEQTTRGQAKDKDWLVERTKRIHSSNFGRICKAVRTDMKSLAESFMKSEQIKAAPLQHGRKYEQIAVKKYEEVKGVQTQACGIFVSPSHPFLASTPDGVVSDSIILEVKCPYASREQMITPVTVPYLKLVNGILCLSETDKYFYQVQGQMFCTGRQLCHFVVYTFKDVKVINVERNEDFITAMVEKLQLFYVGYFRSALLEHHYYRGSGKYGFEY